MPSLPVERQGQGEPFVWLHGFTQTRHSAQNFLSIVAGSHEVLSMDLPGHGEAADVQADLVETASLVADSLPVEQIVLGGYSMGGRVALHVALAFPSRIKKLVLLGATRGIASPSQQRQRREEDELRADRIVTVGVEAFLDEWLAGPLFATLPHDPNERARRSRDAAGLASSFRLCGTGTQRFLGEDMERLTMPVLLIAGALDEKFAGEAIDMALSLPDATVALIPDAGHAAHLEQPDAVAAVVNEFLAK